jgi:hypothetical protein
VEAEDRVGAAVGAHAEVERAEAWSRAASVVVWWSAGAGDEGDEGLREVWRLWRAASGRWARSKTPVS